MAMHVLSVFSAARLRGLILIWVYVRCFMEAVLIRRLSGLSVHVWLCVCCRCFSAARLRGLTGIVSIRVYIRCFTEAVLDV